MDWGEIATQGGAVAVLLLFLLGFRLGWWRTQWEIDAKNQEIHAHQDRTRRAEAIVDQVVPALQANTQTLNKVSDTVADLKVVVERVAQRRDPGSPRREDT